MRRARLLLAGVIAAGCPGPGMEGTETSEGSSTDADGGSSTTMVGDTTDTGPSGPCPLEGMYEACVVDGVEGVSYCDEIDGELQWGPCLLELACELGESLEGCQSCTLVDGVPTVIGSATCECEGPVGLPVCEQAECLQRWDYACGDCQDFTAGDCFSYDQGCSSPWLGCDLESPCQRVWAVGGASFDMLTELESEEAAICALTSLRDGVPGSYEIIWGEMTDEGWVSEWVHSGGDGTVVVEWQFDCPGCFGFGHIGRSGVLSLQPTAWFDDCLAAPTAESLIQCTVGLVEYEFGQPPPEGYVPPFVTGECVSLDAACP